VRQQQYTIGIAFRHRCCRRRNYAELQGRIDRSSRNPAQPVGIQLAILDQESRTEVDPHLAKTLAVIAVIAVLSATLRPFNPSPRNGVTWLRDRSGLLFHKRGLLLSEGALKTPSNQTESYTIDLMVRPTTIKSISTIVTFYVATHPRQLLVQQYQDGLLVTHDASIEHDDKRTIYVSNVFHPGTLVLVSVSSGRGGTTVYLDGQRAQVFPPFRISQNELSGEIVVGTSAGSYQPFQGEIRGLAVYGVELDSASAVQHYRDWTAPIGNIRDLANALAHYSFTERIGTEVRNDVTSGPNFKIPARFSVPHKPFLLSPRKEFRADRGYIKDAVMNVAGFVPLGAIVFLSLASTKGCSKPTLVAAAACGALSLLIEVLQYYIPQRSSGMTDIITNTSGAALGAMLAQARPIRPILAYFKLVAPSPKTV
jgi:hypothetical protein